ncbi:hypothetical protein EDC96DRAFT_541871 [Choanephora cucurbitarum]|nr:hypothetical protein EDC96DRAFT_541871 [Choanephora cucurbitarum]
MIDNTNQGQLFLNNNMKEIHNILYKLAILHFNLWCNKEFVTTRYVGTIPYSELENAIALLIDNFVMLVAMTCIQQNRCPNINCTHTQKKAGTRFTQMYSKTADHWHRYTISAQMLLYDSERKVSIDGTPWLRHNIARSRKTENKNSVRHATISLECYCFASTQTKLSCQRAVLIAASHQTTHSRYHSKNKKPKALIVMLQFVVISTADFRCDGDFYKCYSSSIHYRTLNCYINNVDYNFIVTWRLALISSMVARQFYLIDVSVFKKG